MQFSTKCWSEHILSAYKATKDLKHPLHMTFNFTNVKHIIIIINNNNNNNNNNISLFHEDNILSIYYLTYGPQHNRLNNITLYK